MAEPADFVGVGLVLDCVEVWVLSELPVLYGLSCGFVKDGKGSLLYKGRGKGALGGGLG